MIPIGVVGQLLIETPCPAKNSPSMTRTRTPFTVVRRPTVLEAAEAPPRWFQHPQIRLVGKVRMTIFVLLVLKIAIGNPGSVLDPPQEALQTDLEAGRGHRMTMTTPVTRAGTS